MDNLEQNISKNADKCISDFACINCKDHKVCDVTRCVNDEVLFIKKRTRFCRYHITFGGESVCVCPLRKQIYLEYKN